MSSFPRGGASSPPRPRRSRALSEPALTADPGEAPVVGRDDWSSSSSVPIPPPWVVALLATEVVDSGRLWDEDAEAMGVATARVCRPAGAGRRESWRSHRHDDERGRPHHRGASRGIGGSARGTCAAGPRRDRGLSGGHRRALADRDRDRQDRARERLVLGRARRPCAMARVRSPRPGRRSPRRATAELLLEHLDDDISDRPARDGHDASSSPGRVGLRPRARGPRTHRTPRPRRERRA